MKLSLVKWKWWQNGRKLVIKGCSYINDIIIFSSYPWFSLQPTHLLRVCNELSIDEWSEVKPAKNDDVIYDQPLKVGGVVMEPLGIKKNIIVIITINIIILNTMIVTITWPNRTNTAWQYCLVTHSLRGPFIYSESCLSSYILYRSSIAWSFESGSAGKENFTLFFQMNLQR